MKDTLAIRALLARPALYLAAAAILLAGVAAAPAPSAKPRPTSLPSGPSYLIYATARGLWSVHVGGGPAQLIAHGLGRPLARLSSDGTYLLYAFPQSLTVAGRQVGPGWRQLFVCRADGTGGRLVASLPVSWFGTRFAWSADDRHLLYVRVRVTGKPPHGVGPPPWPWELRAVSLDSGTATTAWTGRLNRFWPVPLAWRRDRGLIVVVASAPGGFAPRYVLVDTATGRATETALHETLTNQVVPSPHQAYTALARGSASSALVVGLYVIGALKSGVTGVVLARQRAVAPLHWSLVGGNIAYTTAAVSRVATGRVTFHVLSLTLGRDRIAGVASAGSEVLGWSPDGRWLLIRRATARGRSLVLLASDGSGKGHPLVLGASLSTVAEGFLGWATSAAGR